MERKAVVAVAEELNDILGLKPKIDIKQEMDGLVEEVLEAADLLEEGDEISAQTVEVINAIKNAKVNPPEREPEDELEDEPEDAGDEGEEEKPETHLTPTPAKADKKGKDKESIKQQEEKIKKPAVEKEERALPGRIKPLSGTLSGRTKRMTDVMDAAIAEGGPWDVVVKKVMAVAKKEGFTAENYTRDFIRDHIKYRLQRGWINVDLDKPISIVVDAQGITVKPTK